MKIRHAAEMCRYNLLVLMLAVVFPVYAQQESIVLDPVTGDYTITYQGLDLEGNPKWHQVVYVPATKLEAEVKSKYRVSEKFVVSYVYKIRNGRHSKQPIDGFDIRATHADASTEITPKGWWAMITPDFDKSGQESGFIVGWSFEGSGGLAPGNSQQGFGFESLHLPGVSVAKLRGYVSAVTNGFPDEGPGDDNPIYPEFRKLMFNDFVSRFIAVPKIPNPTPFNATVVLTGIQKHIKDDLLGMKLIDPVLASQLDRLLQASIDAAKINNTTAVRSNLKEARKFLKKEHEDADSEDDQDFDKDDANETKKSALIDRLAARVLDFDLKYVEKRMKADKD